MEERARDIARSLDQRRLPDALIRLDGFLFAYQYLLYEKVTTDTQISDIYDVVEIIDAALQRYIRAEHPDIVLEAPLRTKNDYQDDEEYREDYDDPEWNDEGSAERKKYEKAWDYIREVRSSIYNLHARAPEGGRRRRRRRRAKTARRRRSHRLRRLRPTRRRRLF